MDSYKPLPKKFENFTALNAQSGMHIRGEALEEYALGSLPQASVQAVEMHLLICPHCQDRLAETDIFVAAMREACREARDVERTASTSQSTG